MTAPRDTETTAVPDICPFCGNYILFENATLVLEGRRFHDGCGRSHITANRIAELEAEVARLCYLLRTYVRHVTDREGIDFLGSFEPGHGSDISKEDLDAIRAIVF